MSGRKKWFLSILAFCAFLMVMPGATAVAQSKDAPVVRSLKGNRLKIGFSMFTMRNPYYRTMFETMQKVTKERNIDFVALDAQDNVNKQIADIEDLITQKCDLIIVNPFEAQAIVPVTKECTKAGVPVIAVDNSVGDQADVVTTIQSNNPKNGELVGNWVAQQMKGKRIKAIMISGAKGTLVSWERREGLLGGIIEEQLRSQGTANVEIVAQCYTEWTRDQALRGFEDIMSTKPDFNCILSEADVMTLEALKVLKEQKFSQPIIVGNAADGQKEAFELIMAGKWKYATGLNSPSLIGRTAIDVAQGIMAGKTYPRTSYTPAACVDKSNVKDYYDPKAIF